MIKNKVLNVAKPYLEGSTIKDAVVGLSLMGVALDNGNIGISYVLREQLPAGCSVFPYAQNLIGKPAIEIANWLLNGQDDLQRGLGMAVITAASASQNLHDVDHSDLSFGIQVLPTDTVGMIGYIHPIAREFRMKAQKVIIFDKGLSEREPNSKEVFLVQDQPKILPDCDIVILSGTTTVNHTIDELLPLCTKAREIIMVGASTPMFPDAFKDTKVTILAGAWWKKDKKDEIFKNISLASGISQLQEYSIKKAVRTK